MKAKFKEWEEWLVGDDINSIGNQIYSMIWDSAVFQSINESRKYAHTNENGEIELNGMVHQFINKCFFETQALAIRRILDKNISIGKRSVISIYRLVDDIEKHSHLLTRKNILAAHDFPYNYEQEKRRLSDEAFQKNPLGTCVAMGQEYNKCCISEETHKLIDSLAGLDSSSRSPNDRIRPQILIWLKQRLSDCEKIGVFVDKFIAHSATPESRSYRNPQELDVTLGQILEAHKITCQIALFLGTKLRISGDRRGIGDVLSVPQFEQFAHFDKAWIPEEAIKNLCDFWRTYDNQTRNWHLWEWEKEFNNTKST